MAGASACQYCIMERILPALEGQLRRFRRSAAWLAVQHPRLAGQLGPSDGAVDAHVDRLVEGVAVLHARSELALQRGRIQQDEHLLELHYPEQLRPFPACWIGPAAPVCASVHGARYLPGARAAIELDIDFGVPGDQPLDIYIDGDPAFCATLRSALLADGLFAPTGLEPEQALLPRPPGSHAGLALLREFFTFPARFNVLRLERSRFSAIQRCTVRLPAPDTRLLEALGPSHLRVGWTAQACLQRIAAAPILLNGRQSEYLMSIPPELEVFSIDRVFLDGAACDGSSVRRVEDGPPGHEWRIALRGADGAVASVELTCCRRDSVLARPARGPACRWQLNSLLALEQLPLDACALRELMATQAIGNSPAAQAIIGAVHRLEARPALLRRGCAVPMMGSELHLQVDENAFAGCGLLLFAQVMDRFFGECAQMNTFTRLVLASANTGEELIRCKARNAGTLLE